MNLLRKPSNEKFRSKEKWDESIFIRSKNSHNNSGLKFFKVVTDNSPNGSFEPANSMGSDESNQSLKRA